MTLIELTVIVVVILSLITLSFVGVRAWKRGSDRAACILRIRTVQQAVRSYANMNGLDPGEHVGILTPSLKGEIIGPGRYMEVTPECPANGIYNYGGDTIPKIGNLYMTCSLASSDAHEPKDFSKW